MTGKRSKRQAVPQFINAKCLKSGFSSEVRETTDVEGEQQCKSYTFTSVFFAFMSTTSVGSNDGQSDQD